MIIGDFLNDETKRKLVKGKIEQGDVFFIELNRENGITPKDGQDTRNKYFVVLGIDDEYIYGGIVINSNINTNLPYRIQRLQLLVECKKYSFLHHDSYFNCSNIMKPAIEKFFNLKSVGKILQEDIIIIIDKLKESPNTSKKELQRFHLL